MVHPLHVDSQFEVEEIEKVAEIEWKGIIWKSAYGDLSIKELLTTLKGYGPMEILRFEKPGYFTGELSLNLKEDGTKEITLHNLEIAGGGGAPEGADTVLELLKKIFRAEIYVEDSTVIRKGKSSCKDESKG